MWKKMSRPKKKNNDDDDDVDDVGQSEIVSQESDDYCQGDGS
jgi:hypothetical protein